MHTTAKIAIAATLTLMVARNSTGESSSPLLDAVRRQDMAAVTALLKKKVNADARQMDGTTALHWAAHRNDVGIASALIRAGANVNAANELGVTPLLLASGNGNGDLVVALIRSGANPNAVTGAGESPLMAAARSGSLTAVTALLERGADPNARESTRGQTPLMWAVAAQQAGAVRLLISAGAKVDARTTSNPQLVYTGYRYITSPPAAASDTVATVDLGGFTPLLFAAQQGNAEVAGLLLDAGASANERSFLGQTALVIAAHSDHADLVRLLLNRGADPNVVDAGFSALHAAVLRGNVDIVNMLLAAKADPNARVTKGEPVRKYGQEYAVTASWKGATPLWLAARFAEPLIVRALIKAGADPQLPADDGASPLFAAVVSSSPFGDRRERYVTDAETANLPPGIDESSTLETLKALRESGVALDAKDQGDNNLAHLAAAKGYNSVIQFLADNNVDLNAKNKRGLTPFGAAAARLRARAAASGGNADSNASPEKNSTLALLQTLGAR